jgi:hypothetical protein
MVTRFRLRPGQSPGACPEAASTSEDPIDHKPLQRPPLPHQHGPRRGASPSAATASPRPERRRRGRKCDRTRWGVACAGDSSRLEAAPRVRPGRRSKRLLQASAGSQAGHWPVATRATRRCPRQGPVSGRMQSGDGRHPMALLRLRSLQQPNSYLDIGFLGVAARPLGSAWADGPPPAPPAGRQRTLMQPNQISLVRRTALCIVRRTKERGRRLSPEPRTSGGFGWRFSSCTESPSISAPSRR